jgi:putative ABC transport system permease protein
VFGVLFGVLISNLFGGMMRDLMPMPVFETPFQWGIFAQAAVLGIGLPLAATFYPVWRAVRVQPIDAIKTGHLIAKGGGLTSLLARVPLPGKSFTQMPLRNLLRAPRRTLLTLLGVAMAITTQIAMIGMLDTFNEVIDQGEQEFMQDSPDRMIVALNNFYPVNAEPVLAVEQAGPVAEAVPAIQLGGELLRGDDSVEVSLELLDLDNPLWTPNLLEGRLESDGPGIIIAEKAADDLGVGVGDTITLKHPRREGMFAYHMVESEIEVIAIHANPLRYLSYMSRDQAGLMGLENMVNVLYLNPADGSTATDVKRVLFAQPGIASVREVGMFIRLFKDMMSLLVGFMSVVVIAVLALAFLIAFNSTSINVDERAREIATLFAFGVPVRTVTRMTMVENLITGILGTLIGIGLGLLSLQWMLDSRIETMLPDLSLSVVLSPLALALAILLGVVVVTLTPLLNLRKLTRMNLPSTLRVVE